MADDKSPDAPEPASPCIGICRLEGAVCVGCGRTISDIAGWSSASAGAKALIVAAATRRLAIIGTEPVPPSSARSQAP